MAIFPRRSGISTVSQTSGTLSAMAQTPSSCSNMSSIRINNIFTTRDSKVHGQRKRLLSQAYSKSSVLSSTAIAKTSSNIIFNHLFPILNRSSTSSTPVNIHPLDYAYSIDSFTAFQLGGSCARVCPTEILCQQACVRNNAEECAPASSACPTLMRPPNAASRSRSSSVAPHRWVLPCATLAADVEL